MIHMAAKFHSPTVIYWLYTDFIGRDCSDGVQRNMELQKSYYIQYFDFFIPMKYTPFKPCILLPLFAEVGNLIMGKPIKNIF